MHHSLGSLKRTQEPPHLPQNNSNFFSFEETTKDYHKEDDGIAISIVPKSDTEASLHSSMGPKPEVMLRADMHQKSNPKRFNFGII